MWFPSLYNVISIISFWNHLAAVKLQSPWWCKDSSFLMQNSTLLMQNSSSFNTNDECWCIRVSQWWHFMSVNDGIDRMATCPWSTFNGRIRIFYWRIIEESSFSIEKPSFWNRKKPGSPVIGLVQRMPSSSRHTSPCNGFVFTMMIFGIWNDDLYQHSRQTTHLCARVALLRHVGTVWEPRERRSARRGVTRDVLVDDEAIVMTIGGAAALAAGNSIGGIVYTTELTHFHVRRNGLDCVAIKVASRQDVK